MISLNKLGSVLKKRRIELGLTQEKLSDNTFYSIRTIRRYENENNHNMSSFHDVENLANYLGLEIKIIVKKKERR